MFTKVIDKKTLNVIMVTVVSFYSTVIPLMALMPDPVTETGGVQCRGPDKYAALGTAWRSGGCIAMNGTISEGIRGAE